MNANRIEFEGGDPTARTSLNMFASVKDRWTPDNPSNTLFRVGGQGPTAYSDRTIEDGSYLRLKTITLGYTLPTALTKRAGISSLRFYAAAQNLRGENPVLIASTANWAKFGDNVYRALHGLEPGEPLPEEVAALTGCQLNERISQEAELSDIPAGLANLDTMEVRFTEVIDNDVEAIESAAEAFLRR